MLSHMSSGYKAHGFLGANLWETREHSHFVDEENETPKSLLFSWGHSATIATATATTTGDSRAKTILMMVMRVFIQYLCYARHF